MDVSIEYLESLTQEQLDTIDVGLKLLSEARRDVTTFLVCTTFRIGETSTTLSSSKNSTVKEIVYHDGTYQYRNGNAATFELKLDVESVFEAYKQWYINPENYPIHKNVDVFRLRAATMRKQAEASHGNSEGEIV